METAAEFNEMDWMLKILFVRIVKKENLNPMHFYINEQNLSHFLMEFSQLTPSYVHELFMQFSNEQRTLLDFQGFKNLVYKIFYQDFPQIHEINLAPTSFLTGNFSDTTGYIISALLVKKLDPSFDVNMMQNVDQLTTDFILESYYDKEQIGEGFKKITPCV